MWAYQRFLEYPVKITRPNPKAAQIIISQYGGPNRQVMPCGAPENRTSAGILPEKTGILLNCTKKNKIPENLFLPKMGFYPCTFIDFILS